MAQRDAGLNDASQPLLAGAEKRGNRLGNLRAKVESSEFNGAAADFARNAAQINGGKPDAKAQHPHHKEMKAYIEAREAFDKKAKEKYISLKKHSPCDTALRHLETAKPHPITEFTREQAGLPNQEGKKDSFNTAEERAFLDQAIRDKDFLENELKDQSWHELQGQIEKQRSDLQDSKVAKKPSIAALEKSIQNLERFVAIHKKYQLPLKQMKPTRAQPHPPLISLDVCQGAVEAYQQFLHDLQHPQQPKATPQLPAENPAHRQAHEQLRFGGPSVDEVEVDLEKLLADAPQPFAATATEAQKPKAGSTGISSRRRPGGVKTQVDDKTPEGQKPGRKKPNWRVTLGEHQPGNQPDSAPVTHGGPQVTHSGHPSDQHSPEPGSPHQPGAQPKPAASNSNKLAPPQSTPARSRTPQPGNPSPKPGPGHQQPKQDSKAAGATGKPGTSSGANPAGDKLTKVQEEVAEVKDIMKDNINKRLDATTGPTGEKVTLDDLDAQAANLEARFKQFDNKAQQPPKKTWKETLSYYCCFCSGSKSNSASAVQKQKEPTATTPFLPKGPGSSRS